MMIKMIKMKEKTPLRNSEGIRAGEGGNWTRGCGVCWKNYIWKNQSHDGEDRDDDDDDDYVRYALYGSATVLVISVGQGVRNNIVHVINIIIDLNVMRINHDAKYIVLCRWRSSLLTNSSSSASPGRAGEFNGNSSEEVVDVMGGLDNWTRKLFCYRKDLEVPKEGSYFSFKGNPRSELNSAESFSAK